MLAIGALLALLALLLASQHVDPPNAPPAQPYVPPLTHVPPPSPALPKAPSLPQTPSLPNPSLPQSDLSSGENSGDPTPQAAPPAGPQTIRRRELIHDHHWSLRFLWHSIWGPAALLVLLLASVLARRPIRITSRWFAPSLDSALALAVAVALMAQAITVPNSDAIPTHFGGSHETTKTEDDGTRVITTHEHFHHVHLPIEISIPLAVLAASFGLLAVRPGRTGVRAFRLRRALIEGAPPDRATPAAEQTSV